MLHGFLQGLWMDFLAKDVETYLIASFETYLYMNILVESPRIIRYSNN